MKRRKFLGLTIGGVAAAGVPEFIVANSGSTERQSPSSDSGSIRVSDREKAELRGPVKQCTEETVHPGVQGAPEMRFSQTTEYDPDGRILSTSNINTGGSKWVTAYTYDSQGRLLKTASGKLGEPGTEMLYSYDEAGRLLSITNSPEKGNRTDFRYDEQGRKTTTQSFDPKTLQSNQNTLFGGSPWDAALAGFGVSGGASATTIYDGNDQPTELQILDAEGRLVSRFVRTYDANGRITEENQILENPALMMTAGQRADFNDKQFEATNKALKSMLSGRNGTGKSYTYDPQGRVIEVRDRNFAADTVTMTSYNEHGDKSEERTTRTGTLQDFTAFSIDENGAFTPERASAVPGPPKTEVTEYRYEYDRYGNWTEQTVIHRSESYESSNVRNRTLTYY